MSDFSGTYAYWGPPGTGKTFTLAAQTNKIVSRSEQRADNTGPVVVCSLTRAAAKEIADPRRGIRIPKWQIGTLHSHAYRMLGSPDIAETYLDEWNKEHPNLAISGGEKSKSDVDDLMTSTDWVSSQGGRGDQLSAEYNLNRTKMIDRSRWMQPVVIFAKCWEEWKKAHGLIDFTDMIEMGLAECDHAPGQPDVVIVDEAQDHGLCELALCRKWGKAAGQLILAGDPNQAIYTWRGADPSFMSGLPDDHIKVLSQSYRVPLCVRDISRKWLKMYLTDYKAAVYEPRKDETTGEVVEGELRRIPMSYRDSDELIRPIMRDVESGKSVMVAGTCGYMLQPLVAELRKRGIPFSNPWRRKRGDWNPLAGGRGVSMRDRIMAFLKRDEKSFPIVPGERTGARMWTGEELAQWASVMMSRVVVRHGGKTRLTRLANDKRYDIVSRDDLKEIFTDDALLILESLYDMHDSSRGGQTARLLEWFEAHIMPPKKKASRYPLALAKKRGVNVLTEEPKIYVGTIHSFKGAEADAVYVFPDLSPAGEQEWLSGLKKRDSVVRCFYVAMTRAREKLTFCGAAGGNAVPF